jgi:hypothetical protein
MLKIDWYCQSPLDFEHKNYLLLQYLKVVDDSYSKRVLSPYLLWTEKLVNELKDFRNKISMIEFRMKKDIKSIDIINMNIEYKKITKNSELQNVIEIVKYSEPILEGKLNIGYKLLEKYPQILY